MVYGIDSGEEPLRLAGLPVVEPEIKVNPQFLFPDATLREFTEHGNRLATLAIGVAGQDLNQVSEPSRSITIDDGENVGKSHCRVDGIELPHSAVDMAADSIVRGVVWRLYAMACWPARCPVEGVQSKLSSQNRISAIYLLATNPIEKSPKLVCRQ